MHLRTTDARAVHDACYARAVRALFVASCVLVALAACRDRTQGVTVPSPVASGSGVPVASIARPGPPPPRALSRVERSFAGTRLPSPQVGPDVYLRGAVDASFRAAIDAATRGLHHAEPQAGPKERFFVEGRDAQGESKLVLFGGAAAVVGTEAGEDAFFTETGGLVFHRGTKLFAWDGASPPRALGGDQAALCVQRTCKARTIPIALSGDEKVALVGVYRGGFVSDDEAFALDLATGATTAVVARSKDVAWLSGTRLADGTFCSFRTEVSHAAEPGGPSAPGVLQCFSPPWASGRALLQTNGGAWVALGGVGSKLVTGDVSALHVVDPKSGEEKVYPTPEGGGLIMPLHDGRSVAIEGDDHILLVDVEAETYAVYATPQTVVMALGEGVKAFISTGDGTASLVRYD